MSASPHLDLWARVDQAEADNRRLRQHVAELEDELARLTVKPRPVRPLPGKGCGCPACQANRASGGPTAIANVAPVLQPPTVA